MAELQKISELFLDNIQALPLWVKQVVYRSVENTLKQELSELMNLLNPQQLLQEIVPQITFKGKKELEERKLVNLSGNHYIFLSNAAKEDNNLFEISLNNFWTLAETSKLMIKCVELELVENFSHKKNYAIAEFLASKIRTGELLKRLGKIDAFQLEQAIREQKEKQDQGIDVKIAQVMIDLNFIKEQDVRSLIAFKEEADKRFIMGLGLTTLKFDETSDKHKEFIVNLQREFKKLDQENRILKNRLRKILNIRE